MDLRKQIYRSPEKYAQIQIYMLRAVIICINHISVLMCNVEMHLHPMQNSTVLHSAMSSLFMIAQDGSFGCQSIQDSVFLAGLPFSKAE